MRTLLVVLTLAGAALAGCVTPGGQVSPQSALDLAPLLPQAEPLWPDHQNEPHPGWGWPTLTHPAAGATVPEWWAPIPPANLTAIKGLQHLAKVEDIPMGGGIAVFGGLAFVPPGEGGVSAVVDIRDPANPVKLSEVESAGRGAAMMATPDGRLYAVSSAGDGFDVVNLTDPLRPEVASHVKATRGGHKLGIVPGTPIVYNANSKGGDSDPVYGVTGNLPSQAQGVIEIYDLTDPTNPVHVQDFKNGYGCHHVFFWNDASQQKFRALCAGLEYTQILDTADPKDPKLVVSVPVHHGNPALPSTAVPPVMFSHSAFLNEKGDVLIVGDEYHGGLAAECDGVHTPAKDASGPFGNLWFYDVKDEKNPKLLGWFSPPPQSSSDPEPPRVEEGLFAVPGCTAHHGRLVPDPEGKRELLVMAWYGAGVVLVDFTSPGDVKLVDQWNPGTNTWEAWYYNGYVFTGDLWRGFDVLTFK